MHRLLPSSSEATNCVYSQPMFVLWSTVVLHITGMAPKKMAAPSTCTK